jgi:hypothetical protein
MLNIERLPETDNELWELVYALTGVAIPRQQVCRHHQSPFQAFADAYFARGPSIHVWLGSRGFGAKTYNAGTLATILAWIQGAQCTLMGGSKDQAKIGYSYVIQHHNWKLAPRNLFTDRDLQTQKIELSHGGLIDVRAASQSAARGIHHPRLFIDEADAAKIEIIDAAMGQTMDVEGQEVEAHTLITSTHHLADGPVTEIKRRIAAGEWNARVYEWCWRESLTYPSVFRIKNCSDGHVNRNGMRFLRFSSSSIFANGPSCQ